MIAECATSLGLPLTPDDVVRAVKNLPSSPRVLPRLKVLLGDANSAMPDIVALVRLDPSIAARVLQTANSAYFVGGLRCSTVEEAVQRVGYDQIYELVSYAVASQVFVRPVELYGIEAEQLWKMSVACALAAEVIAERVGQDRNVAYTIGLLHCLGMVALDEWSLRHARGLRFATAGYPREAVDAERATLGFTQADTGAALLRYWEFPANMAEPVRLQYTPGASAAFGPMASLLHAAKWIRSALCAPDGAAVPSLPNAVQLRPLGLSPAKLEAMLPEVTRRLGLVASLLETNHPAAGRTGRHHFPTTAAAA
jgi:HD-like signal output (HDOD) protein